MGKKAFLFPGQGAQYVGMAKDIYSNSKVAKEIVDRADDILQINLSEIMFEGPAEQLKMTDVTQPAIFLHSVLLSELLNETPDVVAGHSLGEYSALVSASSLQFEDALKLVRFRGKSMLEAGIENPGTMAAVVGLGMEELNDICNKASEEGIVQCANFNSIGQIVISGSIDGVKKAMELSKESGARMVKELVVSGAFHSPLMESAKTLLQKHLEDVEISDAEIPVYANVTATPVTESTEIKGLLIDQVTEAVRWEETIKNMIDHGVTEFIEVGPGKVLQGLVKRIDNSVTIRGIDKFENL